MLHTRLANALCIEAARWSNSWLTTGPLKCIVSMQLERKEGWGGAKLVCLPVRLPSWISVISGLQFTSTHIQKYLANDFYVPISLTGIADTARIGRRSSMGLSCFCTSCEQRHALYLFQNKMFKDVCTVSSLSGELDSFWAKGGPLTTQQNKFSCWWKAAGEPNSLIPKHFIQVKSINTTLIPVYTLLEDGSYWFFVPLQTC